jgi:hypothetical protein
MPFTSYFEKGGIVVLGFFFKTNKKDEVEEQVFTTISPFLGERHFRALKSLMKELLQILSSAAVIGHQMLLVLLLPVPWAVI